MGEYACGESGKRNQIVIGIDHFAPGRPARSAGGEFFRERETRFRESDFSGVMGRSLQNEQMGEFRFHCWNQETTCYAGGHVKSALPKLFVVV